MRPFPAVAVLVACTAWCAAAVAPLPFKVPAQLPDVAQCPVPDQVRLQGFLGQRVLSNEQGRLLVVNEDELLGGFRHRPGSQDWIGEHVGKFLHAATLAWVNTGDARLRAKIDRVAAELIKCQEPDGYLGTYTPEHRWTSWDVWVHKYDLLGLLTYHQYTGDAAALEASRRIGDLLVQTFPGRKSILKAGEHVGMAATSVLEPVVLLYRLTGDRRYLDFARCLVGAYDEPGGPRVVQSLLETRSVHRTANGKAYEMLSNLVGLCELARVTGDQAGLTAATNAWEDVVAHQLYITGTASHGEHFGNDFDLPNLPRANVGETCVTTTWIQLNAQLLRLTGAARYGDELERAYLNHLIGAQLPDGSAWAYYTPLQGTKPYGTAVNCCLSSGPRALALAPQLAYLTYRAGAQDGLIVNLFEASTARLTLGGQAVTIEQKTGFPAEGGAVLTFTMGQPATFAVKVRAPAWAQNLSVHIGDERGPAAANGWVEIPARQWKSGEALRVSFDLTARLVVGDHTNAGAACLRWGPLVLAYDQNRNAGLPPLSTLALAEAVEDVARTVKPAAPGELVFKARVRSAPDTAPQSAAFVPFAVAGADRGRFQVWLPTTNRPANTSLLAGGRESRSRPGNLEGSILDPERQSPVVTFDGAARDQDYFAVTLEAPATIRRIVYAHGRSFHDGGWFDAAAGKPQVQVQRAKNGAWEAIGTLTDYPDTTATNHRELKEGQTFTLRLQTPVAVFGVRILGKPACGDRPQQAFSSCAALEAYGD